MSEPKIFAELVSETGDILHAAEHGWDAFTRHIPGRRYHQDSTHATPATEAPDMSLFTEIKSGLHDLAAKAEGIDEEAVAQLEKLQENPTATAVFGELMNVVHLPPSMLQIAVDLLKNLGSAFPKPADAAPAAPVDVTQPADVPQDVPVPAGPTVAGQA